MMFPTFRTLAVALFIATVVAIAPSAPTMAQTNAQPQKLTGSAGLLAEGWSTEAKEADAYFDNYRFRNGETIPRLHLHYATLGALHRNAQGDADNAVLVLHWTDASGGSLLTPNYIKALFAPGRPLDASRYYLIFPDNVGHGLSSKPSDGLKVAFPNYGYNDMVDLQHRLVTETLGIRHLHAILGMSMGGMNAWQWAEAYPDAMDGIMPVVALPTKVSGRNLLWRRIVIEGIRTDPDWKNGNYDLAPAGWLKNYAVLRMMIDGVQNLQTEIPDGAAADKFMAGLRRQASGIDANDTLYALKSSGDYDPEPNLTAIKTKVLALNFGDDEFNPTGLHILGSLMSKVRNGRAVLQPGSEKSFGHLTMAHPELWADHVADFMSEIGDNPKKYEGTETTSPELRTGRGEGEKMANPGLGNIALSNRKDAPMVELTRQTISVEHVTIRSNKSFADTKSALENSLARLDDGILTLIRFGQAERALEALERGPDLMIFGFRDHGALLQIQGLKRKAIQYDIGNPLTASKMTRHQLSAGLYAPLRVYLRESPEGEVAFEYDRPVNLFGQFGDADVDIVAKDLDALLEKTLRAAAS